ncbi:GPP34 family phosphoprotein [Allonocardiopsis opalescens]|uniref:Golgi phosphoprotein 3 GPP34 n=1 Tax=Allonocardiopsis opalescens TaxID=1144618 RepID=A0A2T0PYN4_9ACTN|nr:GPP34 family phosphoprotein [Allonocardiopsis opalescens]PRX96628.1 Golgi phosphoprotein 3 GPP34 [Allonocardiopsis opalescens]
MPSTPDADLTLPQRLYLLSYDLDKDRFDPVSTAYRGQLLCAAALADLTLGGRLSARGGRAERTAAGPPGDPFLAEVLSDISPDRPMHWITGLYHRMGGAEEAVLDGLAARGAVAVDRGRALDLVPTRTVALKRPDRVRLLRDRTREALVAGREAAAVPMADAAVLVIAAEGDVWAALSPQERSAHRPALTALQRRFDAEIPGLRTAIRTAVMATGRGAVY